MCKYLNFNIYKQFGLLGPCFKTGPTHLVVPMVFISGKEIIYNNY